MTKPKKWFLENTTTGVVLKTVDGECIKKRNAKQAMGIIVEVNIPDLEQCSQSESIMVCFSFYRPS